MLKRIIAVSVLGFLLAGCAATPPPSADYGTPPAEYKATIKDTIDPYLKDASTARYAFSQPREAYRTGNLGGIEWTGYIVVAEVNAKNSFGGYTGARPYLALFDDGDLRSIVAPDDLGFGRLRYANGDSIR